MYILLIYSNHACNPLIAPIPNTFKMKQFSEKYLFNDMKSPSANSVNNAHGDRFELDEYETLRNSSFTKNGYSELLVSNLY